DVAMLFGKRDGGQQFGFVTGLLVFQPLEALGVLLVAFLLALHPDAERHFQPEFVGNPRNGIAAAGRRIGADRPGIGSDRLEIPADLVRRGVEAVVRNAGQRPGSVWSGSLLSGESP